VPFITWYDNTLAKSSVVAFSSAEAMAPNASFVGAKMVRSGVSLMTPMSFVMLRAPVRDVRLRLWRFGGPKGG
jgi:hypothetical protein